MIFHLAAAFPPSLWDGICNGSSCTITSAQDLLTLVANGIRIALAFAGALAVIFLVVGGIFYTTSAGNPANIKRGKDIITNAITGLVIATFAYAIVTFIAGRF